MTYTPAPWIDPRLERDLTQAESDRQVAYKDSRGYWTAGRGHLLQPQNHDWTGYAMSRAEDDAYFNADILEALAYASRLAEWKTCDTACRENALTELCFNMRGRWLGFILARRAWQNREWQTAHDELLNSDWAREVQPHGLDTPGRATRIAGYVLTGVYP